MLFDVFTALTASCAVVLLLGLIFLVFWRRRPGSPWLAWWAAAYFAMAMANAFLIAKPDWPMPIRLYAGSGVFLVSFMLIWQATRVFEGRKPVFWSLIGTAVVWPCLFLIPYVYEHQAMRVVVVTLPTVGGLALGAWETWRGRGENLPSKRPIAVLLMMSAVLLSARVPLSSLLPYPLGVEPVSNLVVALLVGGLIVASIILATLVISMSLERAEKRQRDLAITDPLTGLLNRRGLELALVGNELPAGAALVVFDLDRFKQVNDNFGHAAGDTLIASFALICREELRQVDHAVRLGGEEFALVLARTGETAALALAERIRARYAQTVVPIDGGALAGTTSGGVFCAPANEPVWLNAALAAADRAMYHAKAAGRNRVFAHTDMTLSSRSFDKRCLEPEAQAASA